MHGGVVGLVQLFVDVGDYVHGHVQPYRVPELERVYGEPQSSLYQEVDVLLRGHPSSSKRQASMNIGVKQRSATKPDTTFSPITGSLSKSLTSAFARSRVSSLVRRPRGTSTPRAPAAG